MQFQTGTAGAENERVFRVARNSFTKTSTITAGSFVRGNPVILATNSASANGYDIVHPGTAGDAVNELYIGNVHDFPDTTINRTGVWQPEDTGLVQCYGLDTDALVHLGTVSIAAGLLLTPQSGSRLLTIPALAIPTGAAGTDSNTTRTGIAGLAVLAATIASSSGTGTSTGSVFLRCM